MSGEVQQKGKGESNISQRCKLQNYSKDPDFFALTAGLEKVTFYYGPDINLRDCNYKVKHLAEFMANDL